MPSPEPVAILEADKKPEVKLTKKTVAKRTPRMDFGRFDGY